MKKMFFIISIVSGTLVCCNRSNDDGIKAADDDPFVAAVVDTSLTITPNVYDIVSTSEDTQPESQQIRQTHMRQNLGLGCGKNEKGEFTNSNPETKQIDTELKIGDMYQHIISDSSATGTWSSGWTQTLFEINDKKYTYYNNLDFLKRPNDTVIIPLEQIFTKKPHGVLVYNMEMDGKYSSQSTDNYVPNAREVLKKYNFYEDVTWECEIKNASLFKSKSSLINYEFKGSKIPALLSETNYHGTFTCKKYIQGTDPNATRKVLSTIEIPDGETSYAYIESKLIKSLYFVECRGETLYHKIIKKTSRKILESYTEKLLDAPVRSPK